MIRQGQDLSPDRRILFEIHPLPDDEQSALEGGDRVDVGNGLERKPDLFQGIAGLFVGIVKPDLMLGQPFFLVKKRISGKDKELFR